MKSQPQDKIISTIDGNEACASVAYRVNEVCAIYPITPSSTMAELADQWASEGKRNIWGQVPDVVEMQSEAGAAGAAHGSLQAGALTTTFTASQGLLLMVPNMFKIAGELTPAVFHVAARSLATQSLSIFGDHQDVMTVRATGFAQLVSTSVQEAHDMAAVAQMATLQSRVPFVHFFDGFRTSHEVSRVEMLSDDDLRALIDYDLVLAHRKRGLNPDNPLIRGTAANPDTYFQLREASNPYYDRVPSIVEEALAQFAKVSGRSYHIAEYRGHPAAERVVVVMGSAAETLEATAEALMAQGEKVGVLRVRLFRPWPAEQILKALPATVKAVAVLDRTKEPGANGEPLFLEVLTTIAERAGRTKTAMPQVIGGRYGLSSKEFTPAMAKAVFDEIQKSSPKPRFTVGIRDDVTGLSLDVPEFDIENPDTVRAVFFGLGADGTVGANKNTIKIIAEETGLFAQGYFVYDSKKSGSQTVSHLRFGPKPIRSPYLVQSAQFVGIHQWNFLKKQDLLQLSAPGSTVLVNSPFPADKVWNQLNQQTQEHIVRKHLKLYVIDAGAVARDTGMGSRTNTILQTCFFAISGVLPREKAIEQIKKSIKKTYGRKGEAVVKKNFDAVDTTLENLAEVKVPETVSSREAMPPVVDDSAPDFVRKVTAMMMAGRGDELPVSALPVDGTWPSGTAKWEKRNIAAEIPVWDPSTCIQCGNCAFVCPHSVIRAKLVSTEALVSAPETFPSAPIDARGFPDTRYTLAVFGEDCTGCRLCVEACPAKALTDTSKKAINMAPRQQELAEERRNLAFFDSLPINARNRVDFSTVRGTQFLQPLFEFSGACAGCGETPYLKLLSQLFGDRAMIANATGCSSIYGGNLPTTPWSVNAQGRGPAWANSLFEDNAEFGLGMRLAADNHVSEARRLLLDMADVVGQDLVREILDAPQSVESEIVAQRERIAQARRVVEGIPGEQAKRLLTVLDFLVRRSVWIVGGDGWAYDIGSGGLDHVLSSGRNVNVLVLDTEVYSNTGGQASKSTPLGAVAKFANGGKAVGKKDIVLQAISYGNVYVARIAMGANPQQTLRALREAEAYPGPSLVIAYSHCIAHGIPMETGLDQQQRAVQAGHWPLLRYNPEARARSEDAFVLDSPRPTIPFKQYAENELRYRLLKQTNPTAADALMTEAQKQIDRRWDFYENMAGYH